MTQFPSDELPLTLVKTGEIKLVIIFFTSLEVCRKYFYLKQMMLLFQRLQATKSVISAPGKQIVESLVSISPAFNPLDILGLFSAMGQ